MVGNFIHYGSKSHSISFADEVEGDTERLENVFIVESFKVVAVLGERMAHMEIVVAYHHYRDSTVRHITTRMMKSPVTVGAVEAVSVCEGSSKIYSFPD